MGFGVILPYADYRDLIILPMIFLFVLFAVGALYSLIYSIFIAEKNKTKFKKEFIKYFKKNKTLLTISIILTTISLIYSLFNPLTLFLVIIFLIPLLFIYTKSLDKCLTVLLLPNQLTEGDWLVHDVKINSKIIIKKTVHGLSQKDIQILKKYNLKIKIKQGIPFVPAFLITLIIMIYVFLNNQNLILNLFNF